LLLDRCLAQGQHAKRDELAVENFALAMKRRWNALSSTHWESGSAACLNSGDVLTGIN
jgi:hypothetical protein